MASRRSRDSACRLPGGATRAPPVLRFREGGPPVSNGLVPASVFSNNVHPASFCPDWTVGLRGRYSAVALDRSACLPLKGLRVSAPRSVPAARSATRQEPVTDTHTPSARRPSSAFTALRDGKSVAGGGCPEPGQVSCNFHDDEEAQNHGRAPSASAAWRSAATRTAPAKTRPA